MPAAYQSNLVAALHGDMALAFCIPADSITQHGNCCDIVVQPLNDYGYPQNGKVHVQVSAPTTCTST